MFSFAVKASSLKNLGMTLTKEVLVTILLRKWKSWVMQDKSIICQKVILSFPLNVINLFSNNCYSIKGERRYWREQERLRIQNLAAEQNQIKREASAVNRRPEKADEEDDTVPAPSSYDQYIDEKLS